jgi:hypothetical protein
MLFVFAPCLMENVCVTRSSSQHPVFNSIKLSPLSVIPLLPPILQTVPSALYSNVADAKVMRVESEGNFALGGKINEKPGRGRENLVVLKLSSGRFSTVSLPFDASWQRSTVCEGW